MKANKDKNSRRNDSGQPYGVALKEYGNRYAEIVLGYYASRARRFNISVERMMKNFQNDKNRNPEKYSNDELILIGELNPFDVHTTTDEHIKWLIKVFELQSDKSDALALVKEVVTEIDYVLENEHGGFLNDATYQQFRQELMGELAKVYDEPIKFLGAVVRTIALSVGVAIENYKHRIAA